MELGDEIFGGFVAKVFDGVVESGMLIIIGQMGVGTVLDEESDDRGMPVLGCEDQGCQFVAGARVGVCPLPEEGFDGFDVTVLTGIEELFFAVHGDDVEVWIERVITGGGG